MSYRVLLVKFTRDLTGNRSRPCYMRSNNPKFTGTANYWEREESVGNPPRSKHLDLVILDLMVGLHSTIERDKYNIYMTSAS